MGKERGGVIWLAIAGVGYGSLVVLIKWAVEAGLNAETALTLRFTLAALVWWLILIARRRPLWPGPRLAVRAAGVGALFYATNALCYYQGTSRVSGSLAAMVIALVPVIVALLAWIMLGERLGRRGFLALALAVVGSILLAGRPEEGIDPLGLAWLGGAITLYSLYMVFSAPITHLLSPSVTVTYVITGSAILFWMWGALSGRLDFGFAPAGWAVAAGLALLPTVLAMSAFLAGVRILGATYAAIVNGLEPLIGVLMSVLLLGDRPTPWQIVGGGLIVLAAFLVQWERRSG
jgi:drug/metabolite transporter (DMT)-like permease